MNERIRSLAEQAGITTNLDTDFFVGKDVNKWVDYYSQKFAELIVKECASIAGKAEYSDTWSEPVEVTIKKHFGVEL